MRRRWGASPTCHVPSLDVSARLRLLIAAVVVTAAGVGLGVWLQHPSGGSTRPSASHASHATATLTDVDTTTMLVRRQAFCDRVDTAEVTRALGGAATGTSSYGDGDSARLGNITDVAQEYGCAWTGPRGSSAHAWVFAPPVTRAWAQQLAASIPSGCVRRPGPAYGNPTTAYSCTTSHQTTVSLRGLFGDAWLSCDLTGARREAAAQVAARADRWCLVTAVAAG